MVSWSLNFKFLAPRVKPLAQRAHWLPLSCVLSVVRIPGLLESEQVRSGPRGIEFTLLSN